jgi:hypothetical protein
MQSENKATAIENILDTQPLSFESRSMQLGTPVATEQALLLLREEDLDQPSRNHSSILHPAYIYIHSQQLDNITINLYKLLNHTASYAPRQ